MAPRAMAQDAVCALRREIARIEGRLAETLAVPDADMPASRTVVRRGEAVDAGLFATGAAGFDAALGGGVPRLGLIEVHGAQARDAGAVSGFALGLLARLGAGRSAAPVVWIGAANIFRETGFPYALGLGSPFGIGARALLLSQANHIEDALWIAEEAAGIAALSAVVLEVIGNPARLDLTATRRLDRRARASGRLFLMLRHGAIAEPTAAPLRLVVSPARAGLRSTLAGPLPGSIGVPAVSVAIDKNRAGEAGEFLLEWNPDERAFHERRGAVEAAHSRRVVSAPGDRPDQAPDAGSVVAFARPGGRPARSGAADRQPAGGERPADRGPRRTG